MMKNMFPIWIQYDGDERWHRINTSSEIPKGSSFKVVRTSSL